MVARFLLLVKQLSKKLQINQQLSQLTKNKITVTFEDLNN